MFKMLLGSNAKVVCNNMPYNINILETGKKSQPNLSLVMLIKKRVTEILTRNVEDAQEVMIS